MLKIKQIFKQQFLVYLKNMPLQKKKYSGK